MRFHYPHMLYLFGFVLLIVILIYGIVILYDINMEQRLPIVFLPFYGFFSYMFGRFYFKHYRDYRTRFIDIYMQYMEFCTNGLCIHLDEDDIQMIYMARHRQMLKIHRVIHIFGKDGTYIFITNEINKFDRLIMLIQYYYPNTYKVCKSTIIGVQNIDINVLEAHVRAPFND